MVPAFGGRGWADVRKLCWTLSKMIRESNFLGLAGVYAFLNVSSSSLSHSYLFLLSSETHPSYPTFSSSPVSFRSMMKAESSTPLPYWDENIFLPLPLRQCVINWQSSLLSLNWETRELGPGSYEAMDQRKKAWNSVRLVAIDHLSKADSIENRRRGLKKSD